MKFKDQNGTWDELTMMAHSEALEDGRHEAKSMEHMEVCSCCGEVMTQAEVLESYLDQRIEQALEVCAALSAEYGDASQLELLAEIADGLHRAAATTEIVRVMPERE